MNKQNKDCIGRSTTNLGSSNSYEDTISDSAMSISYVLGTEKTNPMMYNWNTVRIKYCDSSSFAGDSIVKYNVT